jgi:hypothetical protein
MGSGLAAPGEEVFESAGAWLWWQAPVEAGSELDDPFPALGRAQDPPQRRRPFPLEILRRHPFDAIMKSSISSLTRFFSSGRR